MSAAGDPVAVLGFGSWGTALAVVLASNGHRVRLWGRDRAATAQAARSRENRRYLPGVPLPPGVHLETRLDSAVSGAWGLVVVVPSVAFRQLLVQLEGVRDPDSIVVWGTKGFDPGTGMLLGEVVAEVLGETTARAAVSGPTFAAEIARGLPAAVTVAAESSATASLVAGWFRNDQLRVYTNPDLAGVQLGGAIKNVMAIATGIADGLALGANARAALVTRGLAELTRLGVAMGGRPDTFMGLTGVGDLILTCTDDQSRNRRVGLGIGRGSSLEAVLAEIGQEAEGVNTARTLYAMSARLGVEMPITEQIHRVLLGERSPHEALGALLRREPRAE